jgi:hypothetical protein
MPLFAVLALIGLASPQNPRADNEGAAAAMAEVRGLQSQVAALHHELRLRGEAIEALKRDVGALGEDVGALRERVTPSVAGPFLSGPPPSSDSVGVAKVAVFAPRLEVDAARRHDTVSLKVRRVEPGSVRVIGDVDFLSDQASVDLPVDQNGALYLVEWSTSEGHAYTLSLRDGASGQTAAVVQVKPLQAKGRFIYVGYRIE